LRSPHPVDHAKVAVPVSTPPLPMRSTNIPSIHSRLRLKPRAGAPAQGPRTEQGPVTRQTLAAVLMISWLPFKANWADNVCCFMSKVSLGVYCWSFQAKSCCLLRSFRNAPIPWHVALIVPSISQAARYEWGFKQICQFLVLTNSDRSLYNSNRLAREDECWTLKDCGWAAMLYMSARWKKANMRIQHDLLSKNGNWFQHIRGDLRTFLMTPSKCSISWSLLHLHSAPQKNPTPQRLGLGLIHKPRPEPVRRQWHFAIPLCGPQSSTERPLDHGGSQTAPHRKTWDLDTLHVAMKNYG
jgi:hypothetical protein